MKPELLAPAGSLETFFAALEQGADAIYIGLKDFSARALAPNFSLTEVEAMVDWCHRRGRRLYIALNSLIKEAELPQLAATLAALRELRPDALIIQDLGVYYLARRLAPELPLHASTLLTLHNSAGVAQAAALGFKRVVLARELTLTELAQIRRQTDLELEIFVHGALCYSLSGLCLLSSFLGGRAATRGRCTQPCRRLYRYRDEAGYILSPSDLSALELVPQLAALGINALKIEGRMKSGEYVSRVVQAYRLVLDAAPAQLAEALAAARELVARTYSRRTTTGFFTSAQPSDLVKPSATGNIGQLVGRIDQITPEGGQVVLAVPVAVGDRLRLQDSASGERAAFTLKSLYQDGRRVAAAAPGQTVTLGLPEPAPVDTLIYKVGETTPEGSRSTKKWREQLFQSAPPPKIQLPDGEALLRDLLLPRQSPGRHPKPQPPLIYWRLRTVAEALKAREFELEPMILDLTEENFAAFFQEKPAWRRLKRLIWALPPIIWEKQLPFYRQALVTLLAGGWHRFQVANLGHFFLLQEAWRTARQQRQDSKVAATVARPRAGIKEQAPPPLPPPYLLGDYSLPCLNRAAFAAWRDLGLAVVTLAVEADRDTLARLAAALPPAEVLLYLYAHLPLMISRIPLPPDKPGLRLLSPQGEELRLLARHGLTYVLADRPYQLPPAVPEWRRWGWHRFLIDVRRSGLPVFKLKDLKFRLLRGLKLPPGATFNYYRRLD